MVDGERHIVFSSVHRIPFITHNFSRRRSSTESEHRATNAKVAGSSPAVFTKPISTIEFFGRPGLSANRLPPTASFLFRGRLTGRTSGSEPGNMGSTPIPEATIFNFEPINISPGVPQMAIWACFGNKCSQVRILLPGPNIHSHAWPNRQRHLS